MKLADNFFHSSNASHEEQQNCRLVIADVFAAYKNSEAPPLPLRKFSIIGDTKNPSSLFTWKIGDGSGDFFLSLLEHETTYDSGTSYGIKVVTETHLYLFGYLKLKKDFGTIYMRPESIGDKLVDAFLSKEIDFKDYPVFSKRYYVLSDDKEKARAVIPGSLLNYLQDIKELELEFRNHDFLFRFPASINKEESMKLCEVGISLDRILNKE